MNVQATMTAAAEIRKLTIRAMQSAGSGHIGGAMSLCEVLAVLYTDLLNVDPAKPDKIDRDWVVLSKGHCGPALYATLAHSGYFPEEELLTLNANGTRLPSHCDRLKTTGIDISTGSLGQGISLATGVAIGNRLQGIESTVYVIVGDGELQEGQNWEALQFIAHQQLDNLIVIVDNNHRQLDGFTADICNPFSLAAKFTAFGLNVIEADGHDVRAVYDALTSAKSAGKATIVILDTEKGYGCNFAEFDGFNHYMTISAEMADSAVAEVDQRLAADLTALRKEE